jgi:flagellar biosynthetic protein FliO
MDNMGSTLFYVVVMVAVLIGAYVLTKWFSKKSRRMVKSRYICVLDRMALAKDKSLYLTEVGGKCLLIGVTNQNINTLGEIDKDALADMAEASSVAGQSGFFGKATSFFSNARNAQTEFAKARMMYKEQKREGEKPEARPSDNDDILERMNRAIEQRQNRTNGGNGGRS